MNRATLDRYLLRDVIASWAAVIVVLLMIMLATRFASMLSDIAQGEIPRSLLGSAVLLSALQYLVLLVPVSHLLAVMLSMGRLYKDNEVAAMMGCGVSLLRLYRPFLAFGAALAVFTGLLAFDWGPWAARTLDRMIKDGRRLVQYTPFEPGHFREVGGRAVFYTEDMAPEQGTLTTIFGRIEEGEGRTSIILANEGRQGVDETTGEREVVLYGGLRYLGEPGRADYDVVRFAELEMHVEMPEMIYAGGKRALTPTAVLLASTDPKDLAELHFRIAAPISVLVLTLLAVPLSHVQPRQGRYGKLVIGIVIYLLYSNLIGLGQNWVAGGDLPGWLGLWWIHALVLAAALLLFARRQGWVR